MAFSLFEHDEQRLSQVLPSATSAAYQASFTSPSESRFRAHLIQKNVPVRQIGNVDLDAEELTRLWPSWIMARDGDERWTNPAPSMI